MKRRDLLLASTGFLPALALSQVYPNKPIRMVVPFPAGGATDLFARVLSQKIGEKLGNSVVVENRPGAGGTIGLTWSPKLRQMAIPFCWPPPVPIQSRQA